MALSCLHFLVQRHYLRVWKPNFPPNFLFLHFERCSCFLKITKNCNEYPVTCYNCNEYSQPWAYGHTTLEQHEFMSVECCGVEAYANRFVIANKMLRILASVVPCRTILVNNFTNHDVYTSISHMF